MYGSSHGLTGQSVGASPKFSAAKQYCRWISTQVAEPTQSSFWAFSVASSSRAALMLATSSGDNVGGMNGGTEIVGVGFGAGGGLALVLAPKAIVTPSAMAPSTYNFFPTPQTLAGRSGCQQVSRDSLVRMTSAWDEGRGRRSHPPHGPQAPRLFEAREEKPHSVHSVVATLSPVVHLQRCWATTSPETPTFAVRLTHVLSQRRR